jgi:hypothetical protein
VLIWALLLGALGLFANFRREDSAVR